MAYGPIKESTNSGFPGALNGTVTLPATDDVRGGVTYGSSLTLTGTLASLTPAPPGYCNVSFVVRRNGELVQGARVFAYLLPSQAAVDSVTSTTTTSKVTGADGTAVLTLIQGGSFVVGRGIYEITITDRRGKIITQARVICPDQTSAYFDDLIFV